jgi:hypothetical protein
MLRLARTLVDPDVILDEQSPILLDSPPGASWTAKIRALVVQALADAEAGREDRETIRQLIDKAGTKRPVELLTMAANNVRFEARCDEDEVSNRAWRLLAAAATNQSIMAVDEKTLLLFQEVSRLKTLSLPDAFALLAESEPELEDVKSYVASLASSLPAEPGEWARLTTGPAWRYFEDRLVGLVGKSARRATHSPILKTYAALDVCFSYLEQLCNTRAS